jgi:hypothetical protein
VWKGLIENRRDAGLAFSFRSPRLCPEPEAVPRTTARSSGQSKMKLKSLKCLPLLSLGCCILSLPWPSASAAGSNHHILLLSIDGLHAQDVARFIREHPASNLAALTRSGINYTRAECSPPADSFPGILAITTGGTPAVTGVYYDLSYDRSLYPPGVTDGPTGTPVIYDESIDIDPAAPDGGGGIDETKLPLDPKRGNAPVYPHDYLRVNTIFEVVKAAGLRTAWSDKHLADEMVVGPSGKGVDDLYIPEIAAVNEFGVSTTKSLELTEAYDDGKVAAILHEIDGLDHTGATAVGVPAIFGMNFQAVSVAQRLKKNKTANGGNVVGDLAGPGGYLDGTGAPTPLLAEALLHTDASLGRIRQALDARGLTDSTYLIITAKHGQAPIDPFKLSFVGMFTLQQMIETVTPVLYASGDDAPLFWLDDQSQTEAAVQALLADQGAEGIQDILSGDSLVTRYPDPKTDPRTPDIIVVGIPGTIFSGSGGKIAEHGGYSEQDVIVPIIVSNPKLAPQTIKSPVQTKQLAPTMLQLLGLNPFALQAVVQEHTTALPGLDAAFLSIDAPLLSRLTFGTGAAAQVSKGKTEFQVLLGGTQTFAVEESIDLITWKPIATNSIVVGASATIQDATAAAGTDRFYRARSIQEQP